MNLTSLLAAIVRYFAFFSILSAAGMLLIPIKGSADYEGQWTASLIQAAASGLIGGAAWILHRDLARWILLSTASPLVQGVRTAAFIFAYGLFARTLSTLVFWSLHQPQNGDAMIPIFLGSKSSTVADAAIFLTAIALLFLSPHIESQIERAKRIRRIRAEIAAESDLPVCPPGCLCRAEEGRRLCRGLSRCRAGCLHPSEWCLLGWGHTIAPC